MSTSEVLYLGNLRAQARHLRSGETIITDAPVDNNGRGEAFSPTDLAATSLANCAITIMGIMAQREEIDLSGTAIEVTKVMSQEGPRRISEVHVHFKMLTNPKLDTAQQQKYERAAKTCPVAQSLHPDIRQEFTFEW